MPELYFRANAKIERLVGRELITNTYIAIFELVKNSFDAGAKKVDINFCNFIGNDKDKVSHEDSYIEIVDDGKGMTFEEIQKYWMELGTPHKENKKEVFLNNSENIEKIYKRIVNGEKGIGRFGVDKIGKTLHLESIGLGTLEKVIVKFNWEDFDDTSKQVDEIPCSYEILPSINENSGVKLKIFKLRDSWNESNINSLKRNLKKFLSPVPIENDFKINFNYFYSNKIVMATDSEEIKNDSFDFLKTYIDAELHLNGSLTYNIVYNGTICETEKKEIFENLSPVGSLKLKIYYINKDEKKIFTTKMGLNTRGYGNIKMYRDNFRVMPYGEPNNDWLEIDNRHSQGIFRTLGTRDVVGYVLLSNDPQSGNQVFREATDRVGLIEDDQEFIELKKIIWDALLTLEDFIFNKIKEDAKDAVQILKLENENIKSSSIKSKNDIIELFDKNQNKEIPHEELKNKVLKKMEEFDKDIVKLEKASSEVEKKVKIYEQIVDKEHFLLQALHEIRNKNIVAKHEIEFFEEEHKDSELDISTLSRSIESISKLVNDAILNFSLGKEPKSDVKLLSILEETITDLTSTFNKEKVELIEEYETRGDLINCDQGAIKRVFENLFSNSIKALRNQPNKKIKLNVKKEKKYIHILISDNGNGIKKENIPYIFSFGSSFQGNSGTGLGLALAKDIIEFHNGDIGYIDSENEFKTTFLIKLLYK